MNFNVKNFNLRLELIGGIIYCNLLTGTEFFFYIIFIKEFFFSV